MKTEYDTIVIGGGMAGIAAAHELARRGQDVLVLEQFGFGHDRGSSAGPSRIFRLSQPLRDYAQMARRALDLWRTFQTEYATPLYRPTGLLDLGSADNAALTDIQTNLRESGQDFEVLDAASLARRYPQWRPGDDWQVIYSPEAGILNPSLALELLTAMSGVLGATLLDRTPVLDLDLRDPQAPRVRTGRGVFTAQRLIVAAGAWLPALAPLLAGRLRVTQEQVVFFRPRQPEAFVPERFPLFIQWQTPEVYGFPMFHLPGVKLGLHLSGPQVSPDTRDGLPRPKLTEVMRAFLEAHLPGAAGPVMQAKTCLYTTTRSGDFVYDTHPESENVLIVSACSGTGFKFMPVHGEIIAEWVAGRRHPLCTGRFGLERAAPPFAAPG
ncbi:N-methyl-L-tryptophan oxidase [Deinococcus irradiatisoli]|uniref:N-methyl-L-tryptophan oxidase n=1 Tax=Deinococcus irradiatisoli TaxID=2202254 RepID=A0A2Z3JAE9_9DEIO|nr:N-methyl-L-tryptophan oxidase [Deinococcus irradiatisoli]AWN21965.1 N-methyl-L-tryptophan oxidase [Deinococcus irradiatisoli]